MSLATCSDGLRKLHLKKSLHKVKDPSALPSEIVMICGENQTSDIFEISDRLVEIFFHPQNRLSIKSETLGVLFNVHYNIPGW